MAAASSGEPAGRRLSAAGAMWTSPGVVVEEVLVEVLEEVLGGSKCSALLGSGASR